MKIFIDFDDVLFNTGNFIENIKKFFIRFGINEKNFYETYKDRNRELKGHLQTYNPSLHFEKINIKLGINSNLLKKEFYKFTKKNSKYIFTDANSFLNKISKKDSLFILSYGTSKFQKTKIENSGLERRFKDVFVLNHEKKSHAIKKILGKNNSRKGEIVFFLDDRAKFIDEVKKELPFVVTIMVSRKEGRFKDKKTKYCDFAVKNLMQALKIINSPSLKLRIDKTKNGE